MAGTNFPNGLTSRGIPTEAGDADLLTTGTVWFVDNSNANASDGNRGLDSRKPLATLDAVFDTGRVTADVGDVVLLGAGHAETLSAAAAINLDKAGVKVIGLGIGANRPTFTFSATDATITMTAASNKLRNVILVPSIDSVVSPIVVSAADCEIDVDIRDASDTVEFVRAVLTTAAADKIKIALRYFGRTGGNACVNAVRLVGGDGARISVDFYGKASTAVVEFLTTVCTDVRVVGLIHNSGTADHTKTVVDTVTGSTWSIEVYDSVADERASGGDQSTLAGDDLSTIETLVGVETASTSDSVNGKLGTDAEFGDLSVYDRMHPRTATGEADIDDDQAVYTSFQPLLTITPAANAPIEDLIVHLDLDKTTTGFVTIYTTSKSIGFAVARKIDGTNWRRDIDSSTTLRAEDLSGLQGIDIDLGSVGIAEEVRIEVLVSAEEGTDVEIPFSAEYKSPAAATFTPVAAI